MCRQLPLMLLTSHLPCRRVMQAGLYADVVQSRPSTALYMPVLQQLISRLQGSEAQ